MGSRRGVAGRPQDRRAAAPPVAALPPPGAQPPNQPRLPAGPAEAAALAAACQSLDELKAALTSFTGCALRDTATQLVFADGADNAPLIIIGEAPGAEEDRAGKPFVGAAGQLLDRMLASIGLNRGNTRIINTVPWRPPATAHRQMPKSPSACPFCTATSPSSARAACSLWGRLPPKPCCRRPEPPEIRRLRGTWREANITGMDSGLPCLPSYHPAYLLRTPMAKSESWQDLLQLREMAGIHDSHEIVIDTHSC